MEVALKTGWRFLNGSRFSTIDIWTKNLRSLVEMTLIFVEFFHQSVKIILWIHCHPLCNWNWMWNFKVLKTCFFMFLAQCFFPISHDGPQILVIKKPVVSLPHSQGRSIASERPKRFQRLGSLSCSAEKPPPLSLICVYIYIFIHFFMYCFYLFILTYIQNTDV